MQMDVILTTMNEQKEIVEKNIGRVKVTPKTDLKKLISTLGEKHFKGDFIVRKDTLTPLSLVPFIAVNKDGDGIHVQ